MSKPICKMTRTEAETVLAQEYKWRDRGLSYSTRRIGAAKARIAQLNPTTINQLIEEVSK